MKKLFIFRHHRSDHWVGHVPSAAHAQSGYTSAGTCGDRQQLLCYIPPSRVSALKTASNVINWPILEKKRVQQPVQKPNSCSIRTCKSPIVSNATPTIKAEFQAKNASLFHMNYWLKKMQTTARLAIRRPMTACTQCSLPTPALVATLPTTGKHPWFRPFPDSGRKTGKLSCLPSKTKRCAASGRNPNCIQCHLTSRWTPADFDHSAYFVLDRNHNASCKTCHTNNQFEDTCYGCHEHTPSNILGEHREEGISNINDCVRCHKSGNEHDMEGRGEGRNSESGREKQRPRKEDDD